MSEAAPKRKRSSLKAMADFAFDEAMREYRRREAYKGKPEFEAHRRHAASREAVLMDICHFLDAIRDLSGPVKDEIRKQIAETQQRKASQSGQDRS